MSFGPFTFGTNHDSGHVEALLSDEPLLWLETAHFRIGCALGELTITGDKEWAGKVREELARLAQRLPNVKPDTARLDPCLRAHLVAQRAEDLYAEVLRQLGKGECDFPAAPGDSPRLAGQFRGLGPYLGMPQKFTILLLRKSVSLQRHTAAWHSQATRDPIRHHDHRFGNAFFGIVGGLAQGERVVVEGTQKVRDGSAVREGEG